MSNGKGRGPMKGYNHQKYAENYDQIFRTMKTNQETKPMTPDQPTATATPRTDDEEFFLPPEAANCIEPPQNDGVVESKFARTLERELSSAQAALAEAKAEVTRLKESYLKSQSLAAAMLAKSSDELTALRAEVERLTKDHEQACCLVAKMHEAAMGRVCGPVLGPVEDVAKLRAEVAELEESVVTLSGQCSSLFNEREALVVDRENMEWLEMQTVEVRAPLNHGSRELFCVSPIRGDGEERPSRLRAAIDAAKGTP